MRQVNKDLLMAGILVLLFQCGRQESIDNFMGRTEIAMSPDTMVYFPDPALPDSLTVYTDTLKWVYEFPPGGPSSISLIIGGQSQLDLGVETHTDSTIAIIPLIRDSTGKFIDTIQLAVTHPSVEILTDFSTVMLTGNCRLFVRNGETVLDSIPLDNPW